MGKWADYLITKVRYNEYGRIETVIAREDKIDFVNNLEIEMSRHTLIQHFNNGKSFSTITKRTNGKWYWLNNVYKTYSSSIDYITINPSFSKDDLGNIPFHQTKRKTFISFYHKDDETKRNEFENLTDDIIVNKSVHENDIVIDNSDEYIKQLIQKEYLHDTTVLVILIGNKTKCRMHIDWEISGALNYKVGNIYAGLLGLILPGHPDYNTGRISYDLIPSRLADNHKTGYAIIKNWTDDRKKLQSYIELAFERRSSHKEKRDNSRIQMKADTCN